MKRFLSMLITSVLIIQTFGLATPVLAQTTESSPNTSSKEDSYVSNEVLVTLKNPQEKEWTTTGELTEEITVEQSWDFGSKNIISQVSSDELSTEELIRTLSKEEDVVSVEPNYIRKKFTLNDPYVKHQWYLDGSSSFAGTSSGIQYSQSTGKVSSEPVVAVVDTGIDYTHEDLQAHMWINSYPSLSGTYGYDFGDNDSDPMDTDSEGHGTHCAGIIAASSNNNTGIAGISNARLMALKVFDSNGSAKDSSIISAFYYILQAQQLGVNIVAINCSWGGGGRTSSTLATLIDEIGKNGALFVFAAGNSGVNHDLAEKTCPYDINSNYVVKVGASDTNDKKAYFSDYGKTTVDLFAPGTNMLSTVNSTIFSPLFYDTTQKTQLCQYYSAYNTNDTPLYSASDIGQNDDHTTYLGTTFSSADYQNNANSGSLCVSFSSDTQRSRLRYYLDVTELSFESGKYYYISYDLGMKNSAGSISWEHSSLKRTSDNLVTYNNRIYLPLVQLTGDFRSLNSIYIDNPAVSSAVTTPALFGKYNVYSGTSMAAPCVTGTVALLAGSYPNDTATIRRTRLFSCVRKNANISNYCSTGGILDTSKIAASAAITATTVTQKTNTATTKVKVKKVKLNKKKATLRYGKKLKLKATLTPKKATNKKVKWYVSKKKYASVTQKGVVKAKKKGIGHTVKVYAKAKDGSGKKAYCKVTIKKRKKSKN